LASSAYHLPESFDGALLRTKVDVNHSKALAIAFGPFEIVEQAPVMISAHVSAVGDGAAKSTEIAAHEFDAALIGNSAVFIGSVEIRGAVFGDFDGRPYSLWMRRTRS